MGEIVGPGIGELGGDLFPAPAAPPAPTRSAKAARRLRQVPRTGGVVAYDAGRQSRLDLGWTPPSAGPNRLAEETLPLARRRIRDLVDNNPIIAGACKTIRANVVGTGIDAQPNTEWPDLNEQIAERWEVRKQAVDIERSETLGQNQGRWFEEVFAAGECGSGYPVAPAWNDYKEGPAIELVDSDRFDFLRNEFLRRNGNGRRIRQGVEFDELGRRVGYHVLLDHPDDVGVLSMASAMARESKFISSRNLHLGFVPRRINQIRGVPWPVSVVASARMEDAFLEAMLLLARASACVGLYLTGANVEAVMAANEQDASDPAYCVSPEGDPITRLSAGLIGLLPEGVKPELLSPDVPGPTFEATDQVLLRRMAAGLGISYATLARDFTKSTFAATRGEQLEDRKGYRPLQRLTWTQHSQRFYELGIRYDIASGALKLTAQQRQAFRDDPRRLYRAIVIAPGWEWVDPQREAQADKTAIEIGAKSVAEVAASRGRHWRDIADEQLQYEKYLREQRAKLGLSVPPPPGGGASGQDEDEPNDEDEDREGGDRQDDQERNQ